MRRLHVLLAFVLSSLLLRGDAQSPESKPDDRILPVVVPGNTCDQTQAPLNAVTWNVALAPGMNPLYRPRLAPVLESIRSLQFDVLCVQEAWFDKDKRAIIAASGLPPENVFIHDTAGLAEDEADTCNSSVLDLALSCAKYACVDSPPEDTTICAMENCGTELKILYASDKRCINCLAANVGKGPEEIVKACSGKSSSRIYGGSNGIVLLSRWPLHDREPLFLPSSSANRPALLARINVPGMSQPMEVACTHLSAPQMIPPTHTGFPSWEDEQRAQLNTVSSRLDVRAQGRPQLFLGDMNFCAGDGVELESFSRRACEDAYGIGFRDPANESRPRFCSICGENTLRGVPGGLGMLVDHVLFRDPPGGAEMQPVCSDRLFDQFVQVPDFRGRPVRTSLSDHYAVRVKFGFK